MLFFMPSQKALSHIREVVGELTEATEEDEVKLACMSGGGNPWIVPGSAHAARRSGPSAVESAEAAHRQAVEDHTAAMRRWEAEQARLDDEEEEQRLRQSSEAEASLLNTAAAGEVEEDPFNLDSLMEAPPPPATNCAKRRAPPPAPPPPRSSFVAAAAPVALTSAWDAVEIGCMRREAVIQVGVDSCKTCAVVFITIRTCPILFVAPESISGLHQ